MTKTHVRSVTAAFGLSLSVAAAGCANQSAPPSGDTNPPLTVSAPPSTAPGGASTSAGGQPATTAQTAPGAPGTSGTAAPAAAATAPTPAPVPAVPTRDVTATGLRAIVTAAQSAGGTPYEIDDRDGDGTWEVDVRVDNRSVEVTVSADGLSVVKTENDDSMDGDDIAGLNAATITLTDAIQRATTHVGGVLDDADLDEDDGVHYWEVTVDAAGGADDVEVKINVATGAVISVDR